MRNAQWQAEEMLANPSFGMAVVMVSVSLAAFVGLSWLFEAAFGWVWPQIVLALGAVVFLMQGLPTDMSQELAGQSQRIFTIPLWIARTALLFVYFGIYIGFFELGSPARWALFFFTSAVVGPLMWFALLQVRQAGLQALIGMLSPSRVTSVALIAVSQVALWAAVLGAWFGDLGIAVAIIFTLAAGVWHLVGNVIMLKQLLAGQRAPVAGKGGDMA